ncbi:hypothetical protein AMIS_9310 [Actinoplanes missouriensis 431]|uniref:Uncharacterized protein n=1 Tax=Actinoplanes missouriensis (strain ATCC 14538 / DSM 43046 / CBS 188.64 / JCM 3121 / NBRC 102363 / NCIMB 12654 / NRRL B-3342 / UNCC 431) TaxID=512565 RepID=I0GZG4_ACTM4|nr:hypothetical protein [Actinoplanes missouriensis]BAL86151.1 hypothetical protein AMIS_9310 [Actinoplanes missouriensis 431]
MQNSAVPFVVVWQSTPEAARLPAGSDPRTARRILRMRRAVALARADRAFGELVSSS